MLGTAGIDAASSAQYKWVCTNGHSGGELRGAGTGDGGCEMVAVGDSDTSTAVEGAEGVETAHLWVSWDELGCTGVNGGIDGEQGVSLSIDDAVSDSAGVYDAGGSETARFWGS